MADRFQKFDDDARQLLTWAQEEARRHRSLFIGDEHFLLGLLDLPRCRGTRILAALVPSLVDVRLAAEATLGDAESRTAIQAVGLSLNAKRTMARAATVAREVGSETVGSEHLLLALLQGGGVAAAVLSAFGASSEAATSLIRLLQGGGAIPDDLGRAREPALLRAALVAALAALRAAGSPGDGDVNPDEVSDAAARAGALERLIAELPDEPDATAELAERLSTSAPQQAASDEQPSARARPERIAPIELPPESSQPPPFTQRFDKFSERARHVLTLAQEEAQRFNHNYIGTEHLLLGLVREGEGEGVGARVLASLGVEIKKVRSAVEFIIGRGDSAALGEIGLTPRAKHVIELAVDEARRLNHGYIGTEHLLLGLIREGEGIAAGVLESLGVNLERVRAETTRILAQAPAFASGQLGRTSVESPRRTGSGGFGTAGSSSGATGSALELARATVAALAALRRAQAAADAVGESAFAAGVGAIEVRLRALLAGERPAQPATVAPEGVVVPPGAATAVELDEYSRHAVSVPTAAALSAVQGAKQAAIDARLDELAASLRQMELQLGHLSEALERGDPRLGVGFAPDTRPLSTADQALWFALEALDHAVRAATDAKQAVRVAQLEEMHRALRVIAAEPFVAGAPAGDAGDAPYDDEQSAPSPAHEELALSILLRVQRVAAIRGRVRRAAALASITQQLEALINEHAPPPASETVVRNSVAVVGAAAAGQATRAWEEVGCGQAIFQLLVAGIKAKSRHNATLDAALEAIVTALRSLPDDDNGGEGVGIPAVPPPKPPFAERAEQQLDA